MNDVIFYKRPEKDSPARYWLRHPDGTWSEPLVPGLLVTEPLRGHTTGLYRLEQPQVPTRIAIPINPGDL